MIINELAWYRLRTIDRAHYYTSSAPGTAPGGMSTSTATNNSKGSNSESKGSNSESKGSNSESKSKSESKGSKSESKGSKSESKSFTTAESLDSLFSDPNEGDKGDVADAGRNYDNYGIKTSEYRTDPNIATKVTNIDNLQKAMTAYDELHEKFPDLTLDQIAEARKGTFLNGANKAGLNLNQQLQAEKAAWHANLRAMQNEADRANTAKANATNNAVVDNTNNPSPATVNTPAATPGLLTNDGSGGRASQFSNDTDSSPSVVGANVGGSSSKTVDNGSLAPSGSGSLAAPSRDTESLGFSKYNKDQANYDNDDWNRGMESQTSNLVSDEECKRFAKRAFAEDHPRWKAVRQTIIGRL